MASTSSVGSIPTSGSVFFLRDLRGGPQSILAPSLVAATRHSAMPTRNPGSTPGSCTKQPTRVEHLRERERPSKDRCSPGCPFLVRWSSLEWTPPCHGGDHGFKSHTDRWGIAYTVKRRRVPRGTPEHARRSAPMIVRVEKRFESVPYLPR